MLSGVPSDVCALTTTVVVGAKSNVAKVEITIRVRLQHTTIYKKRVLQSYISMSYGKKEKSGCCCIANQEQIQWNRYKQGRTSLR
jgi:hypothetical protein